MLATDGMTFRTPNLLQRGNINLTNTNPLGYARLLDTRNSDYRALFRLAWERRAVRKPRSH